MEKNALLSLCFWSRRIVKSNGAEMDMMGLLMEVYFKSGGFHGVPRILKTGG
jgi:hypothetical protein